MEQYRYWGFLIDLFLRLDLISIQKESMASDLMTALEALETSYAAPYFHLGENLNRVREELLLLFTKTFANEIEQNAKAGPIVDTAISSDIQGQLDDFLIAW